MKLPTGEFLGQVFSDHKGKGSLKRVIVLGAFGLMAVAFVADLTGHTTITQFLYDSMMYIVIAGLGLSLGENLRRKKEGLSTSE